MNPQLLANGIQLSIAPVFLLTAVAALISALATRLGRVIDRARTLESLLEDVPGLPEQRRARHLHELKTLATRATLINWAMGLLVLCALLIGITILELFLGEISTVATARISVVVPISFIAGLTSFNAALICFLIEVWMTTRTVRIGHAIVASVANAPTVTPPAADK
jgi:hypothetical protein